VLELNEEDKRFLWNLVHNNDPNLINDFNKLKDKKKIFKYCNKCNIELQLQNFLKKNSTNLKNYKYLNYFSKIADQKRAKTLINIQKGLELCNDLSRNGIIYTSIKGLSYISFISVCQRSFRDIDILVDINDVEKSVAIAEKHGFSFKNKGKFDKSLITSKLEKYALPQMYDENGVVLEIHYKVIANSQMQCSLSRDILASAQTIHYAEHNVNVPTPEYRFIHFAYHAISKGNYDVGISVIFDLFLLDVHDNADYEKIKILSKKYSLNHDVEIFLKILKYKKENSFNYCHDHNYEQIRNLFLMLPTNKRITGFYLTKGLKNKFNYLFNSIFVEPEILNREFYNNTKVNKIFYLPLRWIRQLLTLNHSIFSFIVNFRQHQKKAKAILYLKKHI